MSFMSMTHMDNLYINHYTDLLNRINNNDCGVVMNFHSTCVRHSISKSASFALITSCLDLINKHGGKVAPNGDGDIVINAWNTIVPKIVIVMFEIIMSSEALLTSNKLFVNSYISKLEHFINENGDLFDSAVSLFYVDCNLSNHRTT